MKKTLNGISGELHRNVWHTVMLTPWKASQRKRLDFSFVAQEMRDKIDVLVERSLGSEFFENAIAGRRKQHNSTLHSNGNENH